MTCKARRASRAPRLEVLEARALLSGTTPGAAPSGSSVFVGFAAGTSVGRALVDLNAVGARVVTAYPDGSDLVALPVGANRDRAIQALKAEPGVAYAEADGTFHASGVHSSSVAGPVSPNDPRFLSEWGLGTIDAPYAWSITTGTPSTIVAVLDTGIDLGNPEFAGRIWTNPTANGDGHVGDLHGWNFVSNTGNVADDNGHGSHVSGILAAAGNNGSGIAGVDWKAQIMPLKVLDSQGNGATDSAVSAVYFAVAHGARVINASWGGDAFSRAMLDALNYAGSKGVVFVTAAGNDSANNDSAPSDPQNATTYPASYRTPNELVVAAVDSSGRLASFSNYGPATVDLAAPGVGIVSTVPLAVDPSGFASYDGTSMATPFVSGTVALLAGANPGMTADSLVARVLATAKPLPMLRGLTIVSGVVDVLNALLNRQPLHPGAGVTATGTATSPPAGAAGPLVPGSTPFSGVERGLLTQGSVYSQFGGSSAGYIASVYQAIDGRAPTPSELTQATLALQSGGSRADLVTRLQNSTEGRTTRVARWLIDELGSPATLAALKASVTVKSYANMLANGSSVATVEGMLLGKVVAGVVPSVATHSWIVTYLYRALFGRAPDPAGLALFVSRLNLGATVAQVSGQLLSSAEGHLTTVAYLFRDELGSSAGVPSLKADPGVASWASLLGAD